MQCAGRGSRRLLPAGKRVGHPLRRRRNGAQRAVGGIDVLADGLQTLENGLPLRPIELTQGGPKTLDEWILKDWFSIRFRNEEAIQTYAQRFSNFLERAEARRHLTTLDPGKIGTGDPRTSL